MRDEEAERIRQVLLDGLDRARADMSNRTRTAKCIECIECIECRDCGEELAEPQPCPLCGSLELIGHIRLNDLVDRVLTTISLETEE